MQNQLTQLELLINQLTARLENVEAENSTLKNRLRTVDSQNERLRVVEEETRTLREWKKNAISQLKKLQTKIEKEIKE